MGEGGVGEKNKKAKIKETKTKTKTRNCLSRSYQSSCLLLRARCCSNQIAQTVERYKNIRCWLRISDDSVV